MPRLLGWYVLGGCLACCLSGLDAQTPAAAPAPPRGGYVFLQDATAPTPPLPMPPKSDQEEANGKAKNGNGKNGADTKDEDQGKEPEEEVEPIVTDRPDFTEASSVVGKGRVQVEMGYTLIYDKTIGVRTWQHTFPETLLRVGMTDCLEFRCSWTYLWLTERDRAAQISQETDGGTDVEMGVKLALSEQRGCFPEAAIILVSTVPAGAEFLTSRVAQPRLNLLYGWDVYEGFGIGMSTGFGTARSGDDGFIQGHQSITFNCDIEEDVGMFLESFALFRRGAEDSRPEIYVDGGFTYKPKPTCQLDFRTGFGLNERSADFFIGVGFSICN